MLFGNKSKKRLLAKIENDPSDQSYWSIVRRQFRKNRLAVWSLRLLYVLLFVAFFADFLANEKPIYCKLEGKTYFPILKQYAVNAGWAQWDAKFVIANWSELPYEAVIFPLVPYSYNTIDRKNLSYTSPFGKQNIRSWRWWHWLGTDQIGRDVLAGMIAGTRTAMLVGVIAMAIATVIGVFFGSIAGYFGDSQMKISRIRLILNMIGILLGIFYGFIVRTYHFEAGNFIIELSKSLGIFIFTLLIANVLASILKRIPVLGKKVIVPADILVMRSIEVFNSIPALLLILAVVAVIKKPSIFYVMAIIGLISWTSIASFIRAEFLRIRNLSYIEAARAMGFSDWRIIMRHALPNALTPVLITIAFGIATAILLEAFLSFLGIGIAADQVTWGSMLNVARKYTSAWWLAIFPGLAIFFTVTLFNLLGEGLTDALDPKRK
ncbi:MAG: ABC transporter permease [Saprospiraceae bacterium]|nr:ABC transporter permease [Saprospiraceae bacterium]